MRNPIRNIITSRKPKRWELRSCVIIGLLPLLLPLLPLTSGCKATSDLKVPKDIKERFAIDAFSIDAPGKAGTTGSGSAEAFKALDTAKKAISSLSILSEYLEEGGEQNRDLTVFLALEGAPRVIDQVIRYSRDRSRLDVERIGDHAFFYVQYDDGSGFDPDSAVGESRMLIEGSTVDPPANGQRATITSAKGVADPNRGYLRFHLNHRQEDESPTHSAVQLDYRLDEKAESYHFTFFIREDSKQSTAMRGLWLLKNITSGAAFIYVSQKKGAVLSFSLLAQFEPSGGHAVWNGDGTLWGCFDGSGGELGNQDSPEACTAFQAPFAAPPALPDIWPGLPAGVPR